VKISGRRVSTVAIAAIAALGIAYIVRAAQARYALRVPDGLAFAEFKGYDAWQDLAVSETEGSVKVILANAIMVRAYKAGVPSNGMPFPEGSKIVKIEWSKRRNAVSPYFVEVPGTLKSLAFIEKDSDRFPRTHGWAYAKFFYDPATKTFAPAEAGFECGYACHTRVAAHDYIFTEYPFR